jgi:hypothetical protein
MSMFDCARRSASMRRMQLRWLACREPEPALRGARSTKHPRFAASSTMRRSFASFAVMLIAHANGDAARALPSRQHNFAAMPARIRIIGAAKLSQCAQVALAQTLWLDALCTKRLC